MTKTAKKRITFTFSASDAAEVFLVGDFNGWDETAAPMKYKATGEFEKILQLSPGRYEYKFKVDGRWECDPGNWDRCENPHGSMNSVLTVAE